MVIQSLPNELDHPANGTYSNPEPRVKSPDMVIRKPVVPGSKSWAHAKELEKPPPKDKVGTQPTNRDRYEDKPLAKVSSEDCKEPLMTSKIFIQPAIPLINTLTPSQKNRAVTDPVQFRSLLTSKKPSVSQLKKKGKIFEFASSRYDLTEGVDLPHPNVAPKALKVLGVEQGFTPIPQPTTDQAKALVSIQNITYDAVVGPPSPSNPVQPNVSPAQYSSIERKEAIPLARDGETTGQNNLAERPHSEGLRGNLREPKRVHHEASNGNLNPPKAPVYGNIGKQRNIVEQKGLHPSNSFHGVIENASSPRAEEDDPNHQHHIFLTTSIQREPSGEILRPMTYSPRDYSNIGENNTIVDYTLPPFTPIPKSGHPNHEHVPKGLAVAASNVFQDAFKGNFPRNASAVHGSPATRVQETPSKLASYTTSGGSVTQPQEIRRIQSHSGMGASAAQFEQIHPSQSSNRSGENAAQCQQQYPTQYAQHGLRQAVFGSRPFSVFDHPLHTANSWAPSQGNCPCPSQAPVSSPLPPYWPGHLLHNPVPSPPASQQDYQRPSPLSAGLAQLDLTINHHIDSVFGSLSRQIADGHDRILDRVLHHIDNFENNTFRELKGLKMELKSVKKEIGKLQALVSENSHNHNSILKNSQILGSKIEGLEKHMADIGCKDHIRFVDQNNSEFSADCSHHRLNHRRTESAHGSLSGSPAYGLQRMPTYQENGTAPLTTSRSSSNIRQNINSNGSRRERNRSRAVTGSSQQGNEAWKASFAELAIVDKNKTAPDLRDHPAYRQHDNIVEKQGNLMGTEEISAAEGLIDGDWYRQAYGKGI